jgi:serine/threonine-protein kinase
VFVCYAHIDADVVYAEISWLHDQGFNVWYDEGISPGTTWRNELADSISGARLCLFFVSPHSTDSINCQREVSFAIDHDTPVLAVHLEETDLSSGMDLALSTVQAILKYDLADLDYRSKLLLGVSEHLQRGIAAVGSGEGLRSSTKPLKLASLGLVAALAAAGGMLAGWGIQFQDAGSTVASPVVVAELNLDEDQKHTSSSVPPALSPDGSLLAFSTLVTISGRGMGTALHGRNMRTGHWLRFEDTDGADSPFFSPDGKWIGYAARDRLRKVASSGGVPVDVCVLPRGARLLGATWLPDDTIVFATNALPGLRRVRAVGGEIDILTRPEIEGERHSYPHTLPTGDLLFTIESGGTGRTAHLSMESGEVDLVDVSGHQMAPHYLRSGHLLFTTRDRPGASTRVMVLRFDLDSLQAESEAVTALEDVQSWGGVSSGNFAISRTGTLVYMRDHGPQLLARMVRVSRQGRVEPFSDERIFHYPRSSPDGKWVAVSIHAADRSDHDLYLYEAGRNAGTRLTSGVNGHVPVWTPDSQRITFARTPTAGPGSTDLDLFWKAINEDGDGQPLLEAPGRQIPRSWSADGQRLLYEDVTVATGKDLWVLTPGEEPEPVLTSVVNERAGVFSPDGSFIAYVSDATDGDQVYIRPYPGPGMAARITTDGGVEPLWSADGRELFYRSRDLKDMISVSIAISENGETIELGEPEVLFSGSYQSYLMGGPSYSISNDGQQFLMLESADQSNAGTQYQVMVNWFDELERLVPAR